MSDWAHADHDHDMHHLPELTRDSGTDAAWCAVCGERLVYVGDVGAITTEHHPRVRRATHG
jgi:hypothetical protein